MRGIDPEIVYLIKSVCAEDAVIFCKVVQQRMGRTNLIKVTVDTEAGITLGQCQDLSKKLSDIFYRKNVCQGNYQLEISSPGVEKPLEFPYEYRRNLGRELEVTYDISGETRYERGELIAYDEKILRLRGKEGEIDIPLDHIKRSNLKLQW